MRIRFAAAEAAATKCATVTMSEVRAKARCQNLPPGNFAEVLSEAGLPHGHKRHAYVRIDLHSRRFRDVEPPSVLEFVFPILTPRVLRGHRAQPRTRIRSRRWRRRPPALPRALQSYAIHFSDRRSVEAIVDHLDP